MATAMLHLTPEVKAALIDAAARAESNMNDVAVAILAESFGADFSPTGRRAESGEGLAVTLRMPDELKRKIDVAAARGRRSMRAEILASLEAGLGLAAAA